MSSPTSPRRLPPLREIPREVGRFLENFEPLQSWLAGRPFPAVDLLDEGGHYVLSADLPGISAEEVELTILGGSLTLKGDRKPREGVDEAGYRLRERPKGPWSHTLSLPEPVDGDRVVAAITNGVLTVTLPKVSESKPRQIPVSTLA